MFVIVPVKEKLSALAGANGDAFRLIADTALNTCEQLLALNMRLVRSVSAASSEVPLHGKFEEQIGAQFKVPAQMLALASDYMRDMTDICVQSQSELTRVNVERIKDLTRSANALMEGVAESGPAGSGDLLEYFRSALNGSAEAFGNMIRAANEVAESNLIALRAHVPGVSPIGVSPSKTSRKAA